MGRELTFDQYFTDSKVSDSETRHRLRKTPKMFSYDAPSHSVAHIREFFNQKLREFELQIDATKYILLYFLFIT